MKTLTAWDEGEKKTFTVKHWAKLRRVSVAFLQQRIRYGFTDEEAVNLPRGASSATSKRKKLSYTRKYDTDLKTEKDTLWLRLVTKGLKQEDMV